MGHYYYFFVCYRCFCPIGDFPLEICVTFPKESQLRLSRYPALGFFLEGQGVGGLEGWGAVSDGKKES